MLPTVAHEMPVNSATAVWLSCWANRPTASSKKRVNQLLGRAQGTSSVRTASHSGQRSRRIGPSR